MERLLARRMVKYSWAVSYLYMAELNCLMSLVAAAYDSDWLAKCVDQEKRNDVALWDEQGNLIS